MSISGHFGVYKELSTHNNRHFDLTIIPFPSTQRLKLNFLFFLKHWMMFILPKSIPEVAGNYRKWPEITGNGRNVI
jgi:hypothetical protein